MDLVQSCVICTWQAATSSSCCRSQIHAVPVLQRKKHLRLPLVDDVYVEVPALCTVIVQVQSVVFDGGACVMRVADEVHLVFDLRMHYRVESTV